jgi:lipopolysaccharide export system permease protein
VFFGILQRAIFWELAKVFGLSLPGITGIIVLAAIVPEANQRGLSPTQILASIPLIVPSMMPFIIPPTTLFATCVVYGRLSNDNEITAIKAAGINIMHVVWPGLWLGVATSLATFGLFYYWIPHTHHLLRTAIVKDVEEFLYSMLKREGEIVWRPGMKLPYEIWVRQVHGRQLKEAIFKQRDKKDKYSLIVKAEEAELHWDMNTNEVIVHMLRCYVFAEAGKTTGYSADRVWTVPSPSTTKGEQKFSTRGMTWQELLQSRQEVPAEEAQITAQIDAILGGRTIQQLPRDQADIVLHLGYQKQERRQKLYNLNAELHMRPALSFGCFFFVLVGCPVGIWFGRSDYLSAFITCFMPIAFIYYPVQLFCTNLAKDGRLHPAVALWVANAGLGLMAVLLFRRLLKN